jgi:ribosomal protein S18 acetylase RimI-like enzyme
MFASTSLAKRIETAEARLTTSIGRHLQATRPDGGTVVEPVGSGVAVFAGASSPMNKMIGAGFDALPSEEALRRVEAVFRARRTPLQAEVSTLASPEFLSQLSARGYGLRGFENVHGRVLTVADRHMAATVVTVAPLRPEDRDRWLDVTITSFLDGDSEGAQAEVLPPREVLEAPLRDVMDVSGFHRYAAWIDGQLVGTATLRLDDGLAQLCGAATLPAWRRRGVQTALLRRRLADAAAAGCDLALMTTAPGTKSQENGLRQGFALLYVRALLVRDAPEPDGAAS